MSFRPGILLGFLGLAVGIGLVVLGASYTAPSCCSAMGGTSRCVACIYPLFPGAIVLVFGALLIALASIGLITNRFRRALPTN
jgi:hypothetical protein